MSKSNDGLIYKLTWIMNDEKSEYKRTILQEAIDALKEQEGEKKADDKKGMYGIHGSCSR